MTSDKKSAKHDTQSSIKSSETITYRVTSKGRSRNVLRFQSEPPPQLRDTSQPVVSSLPDISGYPDASRHKAEDEPLVKEDGSDSSSIRIFLSFTVNLSRPLPGG